MPSGVQQPTAVRFNVTVYVDPTDEQLWNTIRRSRGRLSFKDVVRDEIESNLESVSYVRRVSVIVKPKGGAK
jgi:hypothetical protein